MEGTKRKYLIAANWKSNGTTAFTKDIVTNLLNTFDYDPSKLDLLILPGALHMSLVKAMVQDKVHVGAQNVSKFGPGAYTGEVSAQHLKDYDIKWVLIGNSERRNNFNETAEVLKEKLQQAKTHDLSIIYCVGDNLQDRENDKFQEKLAEQLLTLKEGIEGKWEKVVIAYEPTWAFGTGKIASNDQINESHEIIRQWLGENAGKEVAQSTRIIYAGSVTDSNSENLIRLSEVDGVLVGSSSIKPAFRDIFEIIYEFALK